MFNTRKLILTAFTLLTGLFSGVDAFACGPNSTAFCTGEYAMNRGYDVQIVALYSNGTARLRFLVDDSEGVFPISEVVKVYESFGGFYVGQMGLNRGYDVQVKAVYGNSTAKLLFLVDDSVGVFPFSEITRTLSSANGFYVGGPAMNRNYDVTVINIYENQTAKLRFNVDGSAGIFPLSDIYHSLQRLDGFYVGQRAMNRNYQVEILKIYSNRTAKLRFLVDDSVGVFPLSEIVRQVRRIQP